MVKKLFGILCMVLLFSTSFVSALSLDAEKISQSTLADDVPTWVVGREWEYIVNTFQLNFSGALVDASIPKFVMEVVSADDGVYTVEFKGRLNGGFELPGMLSIDFAYTQLKGTMSIRQSDLAILSIEDVGLYGFYFIQQGFIAEPPILQMRLPIRLRVWCDILYDDPLPFIPFPLEEGNIGVTNATNISINDISSPLLKFVSKFSNVIFYGRLSSFIAERNPSWAGIVDNVSYLFPEGIPEGISLNNSISTINMPYDLILEDIEVPAGSYSAYNLMYDGSFGYLYYAPELGWIPKIMMSLDTGFVNITIDMELVSTQSLSL